MYNFSKCSDFSSLESAMNECRNILIYTLQLPYPKSSTISETILKDTLDTTHESCKTILLEGNTEFFGHFDTVKTDGKNDLSLARLGDIAHQKGIWRKIVAHQCLLATYDKLHDLIFSATMFSTYELAKLFRINGLDYALENGIYNILPANETFTFPSSEGNNCYNATYTTSEIGSFTTSYEHGLNALKKKLNLENPNFLSFQDMIMVNENKKYIKGNHIVPLRILINRSRDLSNIINLYDSSKSMSSRYLRRYLSTSKAFVETPIKLSARTLEEYDSARMTLSDKLYYSYKLEQIFNFNLTNCLAQNIKTFKDRINLTLSDGFIDLATACVSLPNTFSRHFLIQMAFDSYSTNRKLYTSCLYDRVNDPDTIMSISRQRDSFVQSHLRLEQWQKRYVEFIDYLSTFAFPIYESYFFVKLYDACSEASKQHCTADILYYMYNEIKSYLSTEEVFEEITGQTAAMENDRKKHTEKTELRGVPGDILEVIVPKLLYSEDQRDLQCSKIINPNYDEKHFDYNIFHQVILSTYNHTPEPMPALLSLEYMNKYFENLSESAILSCTKSVLELRNPHY